MENEGILYVFLVFQTEEVGQKDGGDSQTQLCGVALKIREIAAAFQQSGVWNPSAGFVCVRGIQNFNTDGQENFKCFFLFLREKTFEFTKKIC
ncbi:MAG: hypothetical protein EGQ26_00645 [Clostridiales bacterium]|nr:hypothetical protein [Clostridiales bacterium]